MHLCRHEKTNNLSPNSKEDKIYVTINYYDIILVFLKNMLNQ